MASSTLVSFCTNRTRPRSTISPTRTVFQSLPWNFGSPPLVGGLFSKSWSACCEREGWRDARGDTGMPRMFSAKLPRWPECGLDMFSGVGGCDLGETLAVWWIGTSFLAWLLSAMAAEGGCGVWKDARGLVRDAVDGSCDVVPERFRSHWDWDAWICSCRALVWNVRELSITARYY